MLVIIFCVNNPVNRWKSGWLALEPKHSDGVTSIAAAAINKNQHLLLSTAGKVKSWVVGLSNEKEQQLIHPGPSVPKSHDKEFDAKITEIEIMKANGELAVIAGNT